MLHNWGIALFEQAICKSGEEADALFRHAGEKYAAALAIEPDDSDVLNNWGSMFLIWLSRKEGREAERMLGEAENKFRQAAKLNIGSASYGLACVAGRRGDEEQCLSFLKQAKEHGALPDCKHLLSDPDLVSIRDKPWFQEFLVGL